MGVRKENKKVHFGLNENREIREKKKGKISKKRKRKREPTTLKNPPNFNMQLETLHLRIWSTKIFNQSSLNQGPFIQPFHPPKHSFVFFVCCHSSLPLLTFSDLKLITHEASKPKLGPKVRQNVEYQCFQIYEKRGLLFIYSFSVVESPSSCD